MAECTAYDCGHDPEYRRAMAGHCGYASCPNYQNRCPVHKERR